MPKLVPDTLRYCKEVSAATNLSASYSACWIGKLLALLYIHAVEKFEGFFGGGGGLEVAVPNNRHGGHYVYSLRAS